MQKIWLCLTGILLSASIALAQSPTYRWQKGNLREVLSLDFNQDSTLVACVSGEDAWVHVYSGAPYHLKRRIYTPIKAQVVRFVPHSNELALLQGDKLYFFDATTGQQSSPFVDLPYYSIPYGVDFYRDPNTGKVTMYVAYGGDRFVLRFDRQGGAWVPGYRWVTPDTPTDVSVNTNGRRIAIACNDLIRIHDTVTPNQNPTLAISHPNVRKVCYSPNGTTLGSVGSDMLRVWNTSTWSYVQSTQGVGQARLDYAPDSKSIFVGSDNGTLNRYSLAAALTKNLADYSLSVTDVRVAAGGLVGATGAPYSRVKFFLSSNNAISGELQGHRWSVSDLCFSPNGERLYTSSLDDRSFVMDSNTGIVQRIFVGNIDLLGVETTPNGDRILVSDADDVYVLETATGTNLTPGGVGLSSFDGPFLVGPQSYGNNGTTLVYPHPYSGYSFGYSFQTSSYLTNLSGHTGSVQTLHFDPSGARIASGSYDNTVRIFRTASGSTWPFEQVLPIDSSVRSVRFSNDGNRIFVLRDNSVNEVSVWKRNGTVWSLEKTIDTPGLSDGKLRVTSDDRYLMVVDSSSGGHIRFYSTSTWTNTLTYGLNSPDVGQVLASPNNKWIAIAEDSDYEGSYLVSMIANPYAVTPVKSLVVSPSTFVGGSATSVTGTVTIEGVAPYGGVVVTLSSNNSNVVVPATVTVPAKSKSVTFSVSHTKPAQQVKPTITAKVSTSAAKTFVVTVNP